MALPIVPPMAPVVGRCDASLAGMFFDRASAGARLPAMRSRHGAGFADLSFAAFAERVEAVAAGLLGIPGGYPPGTSTAIIASTREAWMTTDFAVLSIAGVTVPIYASVLPAEVGYVCVDADVEVIVVENKVQLDKVRAIRQGFEFLDVPYERSRVKLRHIVVMDHDGIPAADDWESLEDLEARGRATLLAQKAPSHPERIQRTRGLTRADLATITYTSGTTGAPKGVLQTHGNWLSVLDVAVDLQIFTDTTRVTGAFLFLPLAHAFGRMVAFGGVYFTTVMVLSSPDTLLADLQATRPGFVPAAPRVYEKIYARLMATVHEQPAARQRIFKWAVDVGLRTIPFIEANTALPLRLRLESGLAERFVWRALRTRLGLDRVEVMLSGSAALSPTVLRFFLAMGITLVEAYGLTETCPGVSTNRPDGLRVGTVGRLIPCVELRFADDGEIWVRGPNITAGYHKRPDANAEAFEAATDGGQQWFRTGDIGELDENGFLRLTDRKKDLLKTSGGKFVAPQKIEGMLKGHPPITEAVVVGDGRKYCAALIAVDDDALKAWAGRTGNPADRQHPALLALLQQHIDAVNHDLARFETVKQFRVVNEVFSVDNGLLTASFKVKRKEVAKRYGAVIDSMYPDEGVQL